MLGPDPYTLYLPLVERWPHDPAAWLMAGELAELALLGDAGRRRQWLAGRWTGKQLLMRVGAARRLADVEIRTRNELGRGDRPRVRVGGQELAGSLSIAHTARGVLAALDVRQNRSVGVDLVDLADPVWMKATATSGSRSFARMWFTPLEQHWIFARTAANSAGRAAAVWAVKEAVYKAAQQGDAWSPRDISVRPRNIASLTSGFRCFYRRRPITGLEVQIRQVDGQLAVRASVGAARSQRPLCLPLTDSPKHELILRQAS